MTQGIIGTLIVLFILWLLKRIKNSKKNILHWFRYQIFKICYYIFLRITSKDSKNIRFVVYTKINEMHVLHNKKNSYGTGEIKVLNKLSKFFNLKFNRVANVITLLPIKKLKNKY